MVRHEKRWSIFASGGDVSVGHQMLGKIFGRARIQDPRLQRVYAKEKTAEEARIRTKSHAVAIQQIKDMARRDAQRAATPRSTQVIRTVSTVGKALGERIKKMDPDKFEAYVTGVSIGNAGKEKKKNTP